ncbi:MAG: hypothetical protein A2551_05870 [Elusimicrobia bacterium RIFOXYD2_FULL_34_30]|nr:MAG: hypothetical protein A2551_05870 [Elusimicrobia bacterium RIFOXYD2_FULL_34_30]
MCYILYFGIVPTWHTILFPFISLILYTVKDIGLFFVFMMLFLDILQSFILLYLLRLISSIFVFLSNKCFKKYSPIFIGVIIMALIITVFTFRVYSSVAGENSIIHSNFFDVLKGYKDIILMHFFFK